MPSTWRAKWSSNWIGPPAAGVERSSSPWIGSVMIRLAVRAAARDARPNSSIPFSRKVRCCSAPSGNSACPRGTSSGRGAAQQLWAWKSPETTLWRERAEPNLNRNLLMWNPFRKSKRKAENPVAPPAAAKSKQTAAAKPEPSRTLSKPVTTSDWTERKRPVHRAFPGPRETDVPLRVACERGAYAEVIAHAKESLQAEICGALVGEVCADEQGPFVEVKAAIRGTSARQGSTH